MSTHKGYALIAILAAATATGAIPAFAADELACPDCTEDQSAYAKLESYKKLLPVVVWTDKAVYDHQQMVMVSGHVRDPNPDMQVSIKVTGPTGNVVNAQQISFDSNGDFETMFTTASPLMTQNGVYTITAQYGGESRASDVKVQLEGEFMGTEIIPEFGPIAALVLAVAIISIIAVSAKTRLRLMPKY
ncbi:MAG: PEFG-CTERM sorting domain-containing protein [Nitrosopumilaceae archaeon]